ncbi:zinc ribbon domain-containing protein [Alienimonas californiensis]|uniref:Zinc finger/thioredoxin putative domain-containing protein n=1 Tax=Alienimonas californiensis TaxID=2527989 RepID=A0A517PBY0_9PLAN|nr:hypothetical protein [Alienimonas californiensis]QDT16872.1 hypothetical protein CA12_29800 [Alienimonas californiensis]
MPDQPVSGQPSGQPFRLPCPKCGSVLKLRDRRVLGKIGKCPSCGHKFKLEEPEPVVELELDDSPAGVTFDAADPAPAVPPVGPAVGAPATAFAAPALAAAEPEGSVLKQRRRSKKRNRTPEIVVGVLSALGLGAVAYFGSQALNDDGGAPRQASAEVQEERAAQRVRETTGFEATAGAASALPAGASQVEPITLRAMPAGVSMLVHMRPAELWGPKWQATRDATGPLAPWAAAALEELTGYPPQAMAECTVGWVMGPRGSLPKPAAVFTFVEPPKRSELVLSLPGTLTEQYAVPMQIDTARQRAIMVLNDPQDPAAPPIGLAVAPAEYAGDLDPTAALTAPAVEGLLSATDRTAPLTVLFQPLDLNIHRDTLFPEAVRPMVDAIHDSFGAWTEAVALGYGPAANGQDVAVTLAVRGTTDDVASTLGRTAATELEEMPEQLLGYVRTLVPATVGRQRLVGRLPAMLAATINARVGGTEGRVYRAAVQLPAAAGPNLALASLLTWEAGLSGVRSADPTTVAAAPVDNATLAEKLDRLVDVDFRRTPMQEAFLFIGEEAKFPIELDGNAIRDGGMTQNMTQEFALGKVSAKDAIARIMQNHPKLAAVADAPQPGMLLITTYKAAVAAGQTPLPIGPGPPAE